MRQHLWQSETLTSRVVATPELRARIEVQGRRLDWIADKLGVSKSFMSKVVAGQSSIAMANARVIVALLDGDIDVLFDLPDGSDSVSDDSMAGSGS
jgi:cyanate lyase